MQDYYVNRLIRCGMDPCEAYMAYHNFRREYHFSDKELDEFITDMEKQYVDKIQPKPSW